MLTLIAALDRRRAIGYQNRLLFHLSSDLRRFKALTTGHTVLMGRHTFDSLPKGALPNRRNLVLSCQPGLQLPGAEVFGSLSEALAACSPDEEVYVMGGATVYAATLPLARRLCLTLIDATAPEADAFFPEIQPSDWIETSREAHTPDERNPQPFAFVDYARR